MAQSRCLGCGGGGGGPSVPQSQCSEGASPSPSARGGSSSPSPSAQGGPSVPQYPGRPLLPQSPVLGKAPPPPVPVSREAPPFAVPGEAAQCSSPSAPGAAVGLMTLAGTLCVVSRSCLAQSPGPRGPGGAGGVLEQCGVGVLLQRFWWHAGGLTVGTGWFLPKPRWSPHPPHLFWSLWVGHGPRGQPGLRRGCCAALSSQLDACWCGRSTSSSRRARTGSHWKAPRRMSAWPRSRSRPWSRTW